MTRYLVILISFLTLGATAQSPIFESLKLDETATRFEATSEDKNAPFVILKNTLLYEYSYNATGNLIRYETTFKTVKINDNTGVEYNNKVYIPISDKEELIQVEAHAIKNNGQIVKLDKADIKDLNDVEGYGDFKIFAFEGIEVGSEISYFYTLKNVQPDYFGSIYLQKDVPTKSSNFSIITPADITFEMRGYNGVERITDSVVNSKKYLSADIENMPATPEETYSATRANQTRVDYTFSSKEGGQFAQQYNWTFAGQFLAKRYLGEDKKGDKRISKILQKELNIKGKSISEKVMAIDNYIKDFNVFSFSQEPVATGPNTVTEVLEKRKFSEYEMLTLYCHFLKVAEIKFEMVASTDRLNRRFDPKFENWTYLNTFIFYIPAIDKYLHPTDYSYRLGLIPPSLMGNHGLFLSFLDLGKGEVIGLPVVKEIPITPHERNYSNMDIEVDFEDLNSPTINHKHTFGAHESVMIKTDYETLTNDQKEQYHSFFEQMVASDAELESISFKGNKLSLSSYENDLVVELKAKAKSFTEKAGKNYLFYVGNTIGEQVQMYQEEERKTDITLNYPHEYTRVIKFKIPDGYKADGLEALNINIEYGNEEGNTMGFVSKYTVEGSLVTVNIYEYYTEINYPKSQFDEFREVINAAADFNKAVVVFEKN